MTRRLLIPAALLALAGCTSPARYAGTLHTEQGACGPGFRADGTAAATLMLSGTAAQFAPNDGVTVLTGTLDAGGHVVAQASAPGADRKPFPQVFEGDRADGRVRGRYATPRCRASVTLERQ